MVAGVGVFLSMCDSGASFFCARGSSIESLHEPITEVQRRSLCSDNFYILINSNFWSILNTDPFQILINFKNWSIPNTEQFQILIRSKYWSISNTDQF